MRTVYFVSLGCPKNRVDTEVMLGHLQGGGFRAVSSPGAAELIVVNTCGFIDAAKEESVDTIIEMGAYKKTGTCEQLVVTGCLSQRYAPELRRAMPEVDHFLGTGNFETIVRVVNGDQELVEAAPTAPDRHRQASARVHPRLRGRNKLVPYAHAGTDSSEAIPDPDFTLTAASPRQRTQPAWTSYLKVSEGCSNTCAFCVIPKLRGPQRSRPISDVVEEAKRLIDQGAVELNLVAQDLCAYGKDLEPRAHLAELLEALDRLGENRARPLWLRCLYAYPRGLTDSVIDVMAGARSIVPYLDLPLQHIADAMLRRMRRGADEQVTRTLIGKLRARVPHLTLRTTFIAGMPGETEAEHHSLLEFVREARFEHLGVFAYSQEEDTPAGAMEDQVPAAERQRRKREIMRLQRTISREQQAARVGQTLDVLVAGQSEETDLLLVGRHAGQAPDIDGVTYITSGIASPGDVVRVQVAETNDYDLAGEMLAS